MKIKYTVFVFLVGILNLCSHSQNIDDALRYSKVGLSGTARYISMGGAFGSLGGDISSISTNPASAGVFKYSEITITPSFYYSNSKTEFLNNTTNDGEFNFNLNDIGFVGSIKSQSKDWSAINYAFSYNRLDNYSNRIYVEGVNNNSSISDYLADQAYGTSLASLDDGTGGSDLVYNAYNAYLIDPVSNESDNIEYKSSYSSYGETQIHRIETSGYRNNYSFALATNYMNKLYLGASFNISSLRYSYKSNFREYDDNEKIEDFESMRYYDEYETRGNGLSLKIGFIYKLQKWLRIGGAFQTPITYRLSDNYSSLLESKITVDGKTQDYTSVTSSGYYDYKINSPLRAMGALSIILDKKAIVTAEYEYLDYSLSKITSNNSNDEFSNDNASIKQALKPAHNLKAGFEYRLGKYSLRTGVAYYDSPYQSNQINKNAYTIYYNAGLGININYFYVDFAYSYGISHYYYYPYQLYDNSAEPYYIQQNTNKWVTTLGLRF